MTAFGEIVYSPLGVALKTLALLLLIGQLYVLTDAVFEKKKALYRLFAAVQLCAGAVWFCMLLDGSYDVAYQDNPRSYFALTAWIYRSPWLLTAATELMLAVLLAVSLLLGRRLKSSDIFEGAIKETVDMLPVGICFALADGTVAMKNLRMEQLSAALCGRALNDARAFWDTVSQGAEEWNGSCIVTLESGEAVMLRRERTEVNGTPYVQLTAADISEEYRLTADLKSKNEKLRDLQVRMKAFGEMAFQLAMSEELLRARVSVHDEMGHLLLSGRYLLDNPETADANAYLSLGKYTHQLLTREGEEPDDAAQNHVENSVRIAAAIGVRVELSGETPLWEPANEILGSAVRECAANTVKHAEGDCLRVSIACENGVLTAVLSGSGAPPKGEITEKGGLLLLRSKVEAAGGSMKVTAAPAVTVTIMLPVSN